MKIYQLVALCLLQLTACSELFSNLAQLTPTNVNISIFKCHPQCQWKCDEPHCPGNIIKASFKRDYGVIVKRFGKMIFTYLCFFI